MKRTAATKLQANLSEPINDNEEVLVGSIELMDLLFNNLPSHDPLLDWVGHYAAYFLDILRKQPAFLEVGSKFFPHMVKHINASSGPPWDANSQKVEVESADGDVGENEGSSAD